MKVFKRTSNGLNNQHLFHNVDLVVFLEGGQNSFTLEEIKSGNFNQETKDIIFWRNIFKHFLASKKIKFKSVGSKSVVKQIALEVFQNKLTTVYVAMDTEFDDMLKTKMQHKQILYTYGYSWENECWNEIVINSIINELSAIEIEKEDIEDNFKKFLRQIKLAVYADAYLFTKSSSFFPRKTGLLFCVDCSPKYLPYIKTKSISNRLLSAKLKNSTLYKFGKRHAIQVKFKLFGHFLTDYCFQLIMHYLKKKHGINNVSKEICERMAINKYFSLCYTKENQFKYYQSLFRSR